VRAVEALLAKTVAAIVAIAVTKKKGS